MASTWRVYLCYSPGQRKAHRLSVCMYEALSPADERNFDEIGDYALPKSINGKLVIGMDDKWVIGGELTCVSARTIEFDNIKDRTLREWLREERWSSPKVLRDVEELCRLS